MTYASTFKAAKASLTLLALLILHSMTIVGLSSANMNTTCTYSVRKTVDENGVVLDVRLVADSRLPRPQTLKVDVIGEDGVVLVEVVKPLARVYCDFKGDKLVLTVGNVENKYSIKVLDDQTITMRPNTGKTTVIDVSVETENPVDYALSSLKLIDALLYGYPVSLRGKLLSISCSTKHNVTIFQIFYNGTVKNKLSVHLRVQHNILLYRYSGPPLPSLKGLLDILKERCKGTIEARMGVENWSKAGHLSVEEPLLPLPAGLATLLDDILPVPPPERLSPANVSTKPTFTAPKLVEAIKQAYKRLVGIVESLDSNMSLSGQQATTTLEERQDTHNTAYKTTPALSSNSRQNGVDVSLLLFPLALAIVAYMVWREHRI